MQNFLALFAISVATPSFDRRREATRGRRRAVGSIEADETYFLYSEKGSRKLDRPARKPGGKAKKRAADADCVYERCFEESTWGSSG